MNNLKRYDLETVQACGVEVTTMERADEGEWVRYKDVERLRAAHVPAMTEPVQPLEALIDQWRTGEYRSQRMCADELAALLQAAVPPERVSEGKPELVWGTNAEHPETGPEWLRPEEVHSGPAVKPREEPTHE